MTSVSEVLTKARLKALEDASKRVSHLRPLSVDKKYGCFEGPRCEDGVGRYSIDIEGKDGRDFIALFNALPDLLIMARAALARAGALEQKNAR